MSPPFVARSLLVLAALLCNGAGAEEPQKKPDAEKIPAPKTKIEPSIAIVPIFRARTRARSGSITVSTRWAALCRALSYCRTAPIIRVTCSRTLGRQIAPRR